MHPLLQPIFNRGGAGRSMTREESVDALNPLVDRHHRLLLTYGAALRTLSDRDLAARLNDGMNRARTELAKLKETVYSLAGTPPNGTDLDPDVHLGDTDAEIVHALDEAERDYRDALKEALVLPHQQLRSTAILQNNIAGSEARLGVLHPIVTRMRRPGDRPGGRRSMSAPVDATTGEPVDLDHDELHAGAENQPTIDVPDRREHS